MQAAKSATGLALPTGPYVCTAPAAPPQATDSMEAGVRAPSQPSTASPPPSAPAGNNTGTLIGGTIGGVAAVLLLAAIAAVALFRWDRGRRRRQLAGEGTALADYRNSPGGGALQMAMEEVSTGGPRGDWSDGRGGSVHTSLHVQRTHESDAFAAANEARPNLRSPIAARTAHGVQGNGVTGPSASAAGEQGTGGVQDSVVSADTSVHASNQVRRSSGPA